MALNRTYSKKLMLLDIFLLFLTGGAWVIVVIMRELYRANKAR